MTFSEKVKYVRMNLFLSQEALAKKLGVSFATVNRWETQDKTPQLASVGRFLSFCEENNIEFIEEEKQELNLDFYENIEKSFKVFHPNENSATYTSELNFSLEKDTSTQRWYRYKEGFSANLVKKLIKRYDNWGQGKIFDPFLGSGTTILASNELGYDGIGCEVNPFSAFLAKCKLEHYTNEDVIEFEKACEYIFTNLLKPVKYELPKLSFADKIFNKDIEVLYFAIKNLISKASQNEKVKDLLKLALLSMIDEFARYKKAGNGLKFKVESKLKNQTAERFVLEFKKKCAIVKQDISEIRAKGVNNIIVGSCLNVQNTLEDNSINGAIFSPPYANCFDYTEIYKLELWLGDFVKSYDDVKALKKGSLCSHLSSDLKESFSKESSILKIIVDELKTKKTWDKKIPIMVDSYFQDMFALIRILQKKIKKDGFCCIVVGNSAYSGVVVPTDLVLADYAEKNGFKVEEIIVDRYIITSSQQYEMTKDKGKFIRESVVCLRKK